MGVNELKEVIVYGRSEPVCPYCENMKKFLIENGVDFNYRDINEDLVMSEYIKLGVRTVPQVIVDGDNLGGFDNRFEILDKTKPPTVKTAIESVIKSDGTSVKFDPEKLNKKARWAAQRKVNWSTVALNALKRLTDGCTTKDIDKALIDTCVEQFDEKGFLLAGRILAGVIYKEAYGGYSNIPSLKEHHDSMVERGYWEKLQYSEEEFSELETNLDHKKDLTYSYPEIKQINDKYVIRDRVKGLALESPQMMYMGMAMANMKDMPKGRRIEDVVKLYSYLSDKKICAPTPFMTNLRTPSRSYASCATFTTDDTVKSLAAGDHIAYMLTCASAGIGSHIKTRSKGDPVRGGTTVHQGKRPYYKMTETAVNANLQNGRGGSATMHVTVLDPEIMDILTYKNKKTATKMRVDGIHYSIGYNKLFAEKVKNKESWLLVSYLDAPELHEAMYSGDYELFSSLYKDYEEANPFTKRVDAGSLAVEMLVQGQESGQVYLHRTDELNRHTPHKDKIYSSNLCVAPETQILTESGYIPIAELEGEMINIWNGEEFSEVKVVKTGENQKLVKVTTSSGQVLDCTEYHKWYVFDGYRKPYIIKRTHELSEGDKLIKFELPVIEGNLELENAWQNGFYTADGHTEKSGNHRVYLYHEKRELLPLFTPTGKVCYGGEEKRIHFQMSNLRNKFFVPDEGYTVKSRLDWLSGWLDGDGCVYRNGTNQQITGSSIEKEFLLEVQRMLQTLGVSAKISILSEAGERLLPKNDGTGGMGLYNCQEGYRLIISSRDVWKLVCLGLTFHRLKIVKRLPQRDAKQFNKVVSVTDEGRYDDTYCFTESKRGMGMFNGILTGNCQETAFPTEGYVDVFGLNSEDPESKGEIGLCSLAAVVARRVTKDEWKDVTYYCTLMIDNVLDIMEYPFPHLKATAQARRNIGVGITDLAGHMAEMKLPYSSLEGKQYIHTVAERHMYHMIEASLRLAKERGVNSWSHKTKWADGWLPVDTMNSNVYKVVKQDLLMDWESLRKAVIANKGIRNSNLVNFMPNESSSVATNGTNSILPARSIKTVKTNGSKKTRFLVPNSDTLSEYYELAWDIKTKDLMDVYGIIQCFCDQSISADIYLDFTKGDIKGKDMVKDFLYQTAIGMKTRYYVNSRTNSGSSAKKVVEEVTDVGCAGGGCSI